MGGTVSATGSGPTTCTAAALAELVSQGATVLDVREPAEQAAVRVPGATAFPLSRLESRIRELDGKGPLILVCASGTRAHMAAKRMAAAGCERLYVLEGGLGALEAAGVILERSGTAVFSVERQVRITAGSMAMIGVLLGVLVHPAFLGLSAFVGAGLVFAGVTDNCPLAAMIGRLPWNQRGADGCASNACGT